MLNLERRVNMSLCGCEANSNCTRQRLFISIRIMLYQDRWQSLTEAVKRRRKILKPVVTMPNLDRPMNLSPVTVHPVNVKNSVRIDHSPVER